LLLVITRSEISLCELGQLSEALQRDQQRQETTDTTAKGADISHSTASSSLWETSSLLSRAEETLTTEECSDNIVKKSSPGKHYESIP
jgi:hypothetical protein